MHFPTYIHLADFKILILQLNDLHVLRGNKRQLSCLFYSRGKLSKDPFKFNAFDGFPQRLMGFVRSWLSR